jgi:hypothetical protein
MVLGIGAAGMSMYLGKSIKATGRSRPCRLTCPTQPDSTPDSAGLSPPAHPATSTPQPSKASPAPGQAWEVRVRVTLSMRVGLLMLVTAVEVWVGIMAWTCMLVWPPACAGAVTSTTRQLQTACRNAE